MERNEKHRTVTHLAFLWSANSDSEGSMFIININQQAWQSLIANPLSTKLYLSDLKTQSVPRSKHSLPRLQKTSQLMMCREIIALFF